MSPARPSSRRNSSGGFKPYTRGVTPIMVPSISDSKSPNVERLGFPTYSQYKQVEMTYLQSLTPRRQGKALISQALFDRIWDVLHQPESQGETAQFRFWARKMFTISKAHRVTLGVPDDADDTPQEVLLHDNLLVAIQEQLYDLLCYCHGSTGHGGRDKTCALIRKHYTWVPKDLVSNFIKTCPTCIMKKCGNADGANMMSQVVEPANPAETNLPVMRDFFQDIFGAEGTAPPSLPSNNGVPWPPIGGPAEHSIPNSILEDDPLEAAYREAILRARGLKPTLFGHGTPNSRGLQSLPMIREVSLYKGLPNGWQYRHADYASAYAEFMRTKDVPIVDEVGLGVHPQRPRIPSILPLWGPDQFPHHGFEGFSDHSEKLSGLESNSHIASDEQQRNEAQSSEMSLQCLLMTSQRKDKPQEYVHQIDPLLMDYSAGGPSSSNNTNEHEHEHTEPKDSESTNTFASASNFPSSSSIKRAAASPLRIKIEFPAEKAFQALLAYRDGPGEGNVTPDSPLMTWHSGTPSPASSSASASDDRSSTESGSRSGSQLFAFPASTESNSTTPSSSALPTPVDEFGSSQAASEDIKGKKRLVMPATGPGMEEEELSDGIQVACGL